MSDVPAKVLPPMFLRLPNAVLINFLSEWLEIQDVGWLDGAMTTRALRPTFLQYLQDMRSTTVNGQTIEKDAKGLKSCSFLTWLSIHRIYFEEITLKDLDSAYVIENLELPFLRKLVVTKKKKEAREHDCESSLIHLVQTSPDLQIISIDAFGVVVHEIIRQIADHCPLLEELVPYCGFLMDDLLYLLNKCTALTKLSLAYPKEDLYPPSRMWKDSDWERLRPYGHLVHEMHAFGGDAIHSRAFADFLGTCHRLYKLDLYINNSATDVATYDSLMLRATQSCPLLETLFFDASSLVLRELGKNCKMLRKIDTSYYSPPVSATDLASLYQIETLETLIFNQGTFNFDDLTVEHLAVLSWFKNLKELNICCNNVDIFVEGIFADTPLSRSLEKLSLERISLDNDSNFIPASVLSCFTPCTNLREIDLCHSKFTNAGMKILATHFPLLAELVMGYDITLAVGLTFVITQHKYLRGIFFNGHPFGHQPFFCRRKFNEAEKVWFLNYVTDLRCYFPHIDFKYVQCNDESNGDDINDDAADDDGF